MLAEAGFARVAFFFKGCFLLVGQQGLHLLVRIFAEGFGLLPEVLGRQRAVLPGLHQGFHCLLLGFAQGFRLLLLLRREKVGEAVRSGLTLALEAPGVSSFALLEMTPAALLALVEAVIRKADGKGHQKRRCEGQQSARSGRKRPPS